MYLSLDAVIDERYVVGDKLALIHRLIQFYEPGTIAFETLEPTWTAVASQLETDGYSVGQVNTAEEPEILSSLKISVPLPGYIAFKVCSLSSTIGLKLQKYTDTVWAHLLYGP